MADYDTKQVYINADNVFIGSKSVSQENENIYSSISENANAITSEVTRATTAEGDLSSRITQTADSITAEVSRATTAEGNLSSRITQNEGQIELKVTKGDVSSQLSVESGQVKITSNRFVLESTNCSISSDGTINASNVDLSGKITANSGKIGGFDIGSNSIYNRKTSLNSSLSGIYIGTDGIAIGYGTGDYATFYASSDGNLRIGSDLKSKGNIIFESTCNIRYGSSGTNNIRFSSDGIVVAGYGGKLGFFSSSNAGSTKKSVSTISSTSSATASSCATKINELINALKAYNLIG